MNGMTSTDVAIIDFLSADPQAIRGLVGTYPRSTLYASLHTLQQKGLVGKRGSQYLLTTAGLAVKAAQRGALTLDGLNKVYPPLHTVASPQHRAMLELAISALVVRRHTEQEEHHAGFLFAGPPLTGKSEAGRFFCIVAGADPTACVVDLASESGRSLFVRRGAEGAIRSQRALLSAPAIVLDEYGLADRAVRQAVAPLIGGRRRVPFENELLSITPVPLITMNARPGDTLSDRTGFSPAQLRRLVPCDLSAVPLPDLALEGGRALEAARQKGPLALRPPRGSCEELRRPVVRLLRQVLVPEVIGLVDVELLLGLGRGLTAWLPSGVAMRQALYDFLLAVETVRWVRPGWLEAVRGFPEFGDGGGSTSPPALDSVTEVSAAIRPLQTIPLFPERMTPKGQKEHLTMNSGQSMMPSFTLTDRSKSLLVSVAVDAQVPLDRAVEIVTSSYRIQRLNGDVTFQDLLAVVRLRERCDTTEISVDDLRTAVELSAGLSERGLTLDHVQTVVQVADDLAETGLSLKEAAGVADLMKALKKAGVDPRLPDQLQAALKRYATLGYEPKPIARLAALSERLASLEIGLDDLEGVLDRLRRLTDLGLDEEMTEALAAQLGLAGIPENLRRQVLEHAVVLGKEGIKLEDLRERREMLRESLERLQDCHDAVEGSVSVAEYELARLEESQDQAKAELAGLREQAAQLEGAIATGQVLEGFLLGHRDASDEFFARVVVLREVRRRRGDSPQPTRLETNLTPAIQQSVVKFLERIRTLKQEPLRTAGRLEDPAAAGASSAIPPTPDSGDTDA